MLFSSSSAKGVTKTANGERRNGDFVFFVFDYDE